MDTLSLSEILSKIAKRLNRSEATAEHHRKAYLTLCDNRIIFWGNNSQLATVQTKACYNPKKFNFEFPLLLPVFKELLLEITSLTPENIEQQLLDYMLLAEKKQKFFEWLKKQKDTEGIVLQDTELKDTNLFPHQKIASRINELYPRVLCLDEMGLGKTIVAIRTALFRLKYSGNRRCLIICPNSIKATVWAKEITNRTYLGYCLPSGGKIKRVNSIKKFTTLNQENPGYYFLIINFEMTYKYLEYLKPFVDGQMLIIDEAHFMKTANSQRTKAIFKLNPYHIISMTGTPFDNRVEDVYPLAEYIAPNIFGGSFLRFKADYCVEESIYAKSPDGPVQRKVIAGYKNLDQLKAKLELISYRRRKKEVLDLPAKTYENRLVSLTKDQWRCYEKMREECYVRIIEAKEAELREFGEIVFNKDIKQEIESTANGILSQMLRLSQIADGYLSDFADKSKTYWIKDGGKLAELDDIVEQVVVGSSEKIVIWSRFVEVVEHLAERYKAHNARFINGSVSSEKRVAINEAFQTDDTTMILVAQVQSCGVGMTFHRASVQVFYDKCFVSSSAIVQAEDRLHRIGMSDRCHIISLIAQGTIDEHWEKILQEKLKSSDEILNDDKANRLNKADYLNLLRIKKGD